MVRSRFYRSKLSMLVGVLGLMVYNIINNIFDSLFPFSTLLSIASFVLIIRGCFLRDGFNEQDFSAEERWKTYARSRFFDVLYILFALLITAAFTLAAIFVGRSTGISEYDSIIIGLFSSGALQIICDIDHLNKQNQKLKSEFPPLDQSNN